MLTGLPAAATVRMKSVWRQEKRRRLQDVDDCRDFRHFFLGVHVGEHRHPT